MNPLALIVLLAVPQVALPTPPPKTPLRPVKDTYHGVEVVDPYRWLEKGDDPEVVAWSKAQDERTRAWLGKRPGIDGIRARVKELINARTASYFAVQKRGDRFFAVKAQPPKQQAFLVTLASLDDLSTEKVVLDPTAIDPTGATSMDFVKPSPDGKLVAASLSKMGSESGDVYVYDVATGKPLPDRIERVNGGTAGGSLTWDEDGKGFYYTRYPKKGERPDADLPFYLEVWHHRLGAPVEKDTYEVGREFDEPRIAEHFLQRSEDGRYIADLVQKGDGGEFALYVRRGDGKPWRKVAAIADEVVEARFGFDGGLYLLSRKGAPRGRILRVDAADPDLAKAKPIAEAAEGAIESFEVTGSRVFIGEIAGGPSTVRVVGLDGKPAGKLPIEGVVALGMMNRLGPTELVYSTTSYVAPLEWFRVGEAGGAPKRLAITIPAKIDFSDVEVVREIATSKDGTRVPMSVLYRKGTPRDGNNPTVLEGYGGYGLSSQPGFNPTNRLLLDAGFVIVEANIRGGGEYGEEWHKAGYLTKKQNVFDDFAACARRLVELKYTKPERLAIEGGSNGGLLMGAMITQHPELFRAVVAWVGIFDMLRVELHPNGAFNVTEFGSVKDPEQFKALFAYSPVHRVKDGAAYPAVFFTAGNRDPRVDAYHARKMTARLQAATSSSHPVLLRVSDFGHGIGTALDERIAQAADVFAFLFEELGVPNAPAKPAAPARR